MTETITNRRLITVAAWPQYHSWPSVSALRNIIFFSKENGFEKCLRRIGRRVLIDESEFFTWVDNQEKRGAK